MFSFGQQNLGVLYPPHCMKPVRRNAKRLFECPTEIVRAQASQLREGGERNLLRQMLFDIRGYKSLLPRGKSASDQPFHARGSETESQQFMHKNNAERLEIQMVILLQASRSERGREFCSGAPDRRILEKQPRRKRKPGHARFASDLQLVRVKV